MVEACACKNIIVQQWHSDVRLVWYKSLEERILSKMLHFLSLYIHIYIYQYLYALFYVLCSCGITSVNETGVVECLSLAFFDGFGCFPSLLTLGFCGGGAVSSHSVLLAGDHALVGVID